MATPPPPITMLTDFGSRDQYVAEMKGVIYQIAPNATVIDVTHEIEPQNIVRAAFVLRSVWNWYPSGTVHVAVVDPGVGSSRRILVGRYSGQYIVCPDNGLISMVHHDLSVEAVHVVENRRHFLHTVSATFHGRDIMAPVAAHLARGVPISEFGPPTDHVEILQLASPRSLSEHGLAGEVLCTDRFGNLITNIARRDLAMVFRHRNDVKVYLNGHTIGPIRENYSQVKSGEPVALVGGSGYLEIAVNCGSAVEGLRGGQGTAVEVR